MEEFVVCDGDGAEGGGGVCSDLLRLVGVVICECDCDVVIIISGWEGKFFLTVIGEEVRVGKVFNAGALGVDGSEEGALR